MCMHTYVTCHDSYLMKSPFHFSMYHTYNPSCVTSASYADKNYCVNKIQVLDIFMGTACPRFKNITQHINYVDFPNYSTYVLLCVP